MSSFLCAIGQHIQAHGELYGTTGTALAISLIKNMPRPGSPVTWGTFYSWVFETLQSVLPIPRSTPIQPVAPAQTKS